MSEPHLELDLLGTRFSIDAPERWKGFLAYLWHEFETPPAAGSLNVLIYEGDGRTWLRLPGEPALAFDDPWALAEVVRYWLVEHAVRRARDVVAFHAAALVKDGTGVLFAAPSGAGKTSLSVALGIAGWALASDDIAALDESGRVHPFPKPLSIRDPRVWASLDGPHRPRTPRWLTPPGSAPLLVPADLFPRQRDPFSAQALAFISYEPDEPPLLEAIGPGRAAADSIEYVREGTPQSLATVARLCRGARAWRLRYRSSEEALELVGRVLTETDQKDPKTG